MDLISPLFSPSGILSVDPTPTSVLTSQLQALPTHPPTRSAEVPPSAFWHSKFNRVIYRTWGTGGYQLTWGVQVGWLKWKSSDMEERKDMESTAWLQQAGLCWRMTCVRPQCGWGCPASLETAVRSLRGFPMPNTDHWRKTVWLVAYMNTLISL